MNTMMQDSPATPEVAEGKGPQEREGIKLEPNIEVPDRGVVAWMTVIGAWFVLFATFGYLYAFGVYQEYHLPDFFTRVYLVGRSPSSIAWIGSFQLMMPFALGIVSGKLFDDGYFHAVEIFGAVIFTFSLFMLSLAKPGQYYQIFLSQGVGMGIGLGFTFVPTLGIIVHHFHRHRGLASGVALSGSSTGALIFPIRFARAVRASAYIVLGCLVIGNALMRTRLPPRRKRSVSHGTSPDIKAFFKDPPYMWAVAGALVSSFGFYFPVIYIQLYAVLHNVDSTLAFYSIAILNGSSAVGRVLGNYLADRYGPFNIQIPCTLITGATIWAVLGVHDAASLVVVSVLYGLFAGAWLSLAFATLSSLAQSPSEVGARVGLALALSSFGSLGSAPSQGALLTDAFTWLPPVAFSGSLMFAASFLFLITRTLLVKRHNSQKV